MTYTTKSGDMWDSIAHMQLGNVNYVHLLIRANKEYRKYYIFPSGIVLTLPEISRRVSETMPPWKQKQHTERNI